MGLSEFDSAPHHRDYNGGLYMPIRNGNFNRCLSSIDEGLPQIHPDETKTEVIIPQSMKLFDNQVAGHTWGENTMGIMKDDDTILKPITPSKLRCGEREVEFYERIQTSQDSNVTVLKDFVAKYFGTKNVSINGKNYECIVLEDLTADYVEPCIMDIKIGRRTWDPEASYDKIMKEEQKYRECKRELGFCVPGFQVHNISSNELAKYDKSYGKNLNAETTREALRVFLNGENGFCRSLLVQILSPLWRIQHWARNQRQFKIFSSSILIVYDARRLKDCLKYKGGLIPAAKLTRSGSLYRPLSLAVLNNAPDKIPTGFSGQLTKEGPILTPSSRKKYLEFPQRRNSNNVWEQSMTTLKRTHSFQNDYDKNFQTRKQDYRHILEDLCCEYKSEMWSNVKMIDFARAFPAQKCDIDYNFLEGIENLIKILEEFLTESD